ncbi:BFH_HP2_G0029910.mRNA.1.CDS.1 [Saccharomyces cerevisiae]|nr:BFH_HP2_G0029910.mRNA.1.CDS.1 [Saccharomyces cerevisiae]CAI6593470.1 BFH_HP2_G0029910.mRNA.1.CDS.1 [Saccharomyces cerevisiae]
MNSLANNNKLSTEDEEIHSARKRGYNEEQNYSEARKKQRDQGLLSQESNDGNIDSALLSEGATLKGTQSQYESGLTSNKDEKGSDDEDASVAEAAVAATVNYTDLIQGQEDSSDAHTSNQTNANGEHKDSLNGERAITPSNEGVKSNTSLEGMTSSPMESTQQSKKDMLIPLAEHDRGPEHQQDDEDNDDADIDLKKDISMQPGRRGRKPTTLATTDEWKKQRKDSHKEVERRRRENINTAINVLSDLLPVRESSKAAILARAAEYIQKLKETDEANIEKWTLQKLLSEQNASQLASTNEKLQEELGNAYKEIEYMKRVLRKEGIEYEDMHTHKKQENERKSTRSDNPHEA